MVYLASLAFIVAFAGMAPPKYGLQQNNYKNYMILCGFLIAAVAGLRSPYVGSADSYGYVVGFRRLRTYDRFGDYYDQYLGGHGLLFSEAGFSYFVWLLGRVFNGDQTLLIASSLVITWATCRFISRNSVEAPLSLTIYVCLTLFTFNMNGMRQAMAMSICLFAYEHAKNKKLIPFVLTVLLAMLFHKSAMCFFVVYLFPRVKNTGVNWLAYIVVLLIILLSIDKIVAGYAASGKDYTETSSAEGGGLFVVLLYLGAIVLTLYKHKVLEKPTARTAFIGSLAGFAAYVSRYFGADILERMSYYFYYFLLLLIPEVVQELEGEEHRFIRIFFAIGAVLLFAYRVWNSSFRYFTLFFL